jgi:SAM-dependent methyltransferase
VRPNIDVRPGENVDLVADFEKPLPLESNQFDGVFSKFAAEHISWRTVDGWFAETHRILKPGGVLVLVVPNLLEQMRLNVELGDRGEWEWDNGVACRIFGDCDYPQNSHRAGWSPEAIARALRGVGYASVLVLPFGELRTDMIVECVK